MTASRYDDVLLTSVPAADHAAVRAFLPGARVETAPISEALVARHHDARVVAVMIHDPVDETLLSGFDDLRGVITRSTGYDHLPLGWMRRHGVVACNLGDYAVPGVAHLALGFILALLRRTPEAMAMTQGAARGGQDPPRWDRSGLVGRSLLDVTVGVLGTGRIGSRVVRDLVGLGATVVGHDLVRDPDLEKLAGFRYVDPLPAFLAASEVLTVHLPLTAETDQIIDRHALGLLPRGALLVNTARGRVVDTLAVLRALRSGRLAGFAADVLPGEPEPPLLPRLRDETNVLLTPHLGAYDRRSIEERYKATAEAARAILGPDPVLLNRYQVA